jgi:hypothetical protein
MRPGVSEIAAASDFDASGAGATRDQGAAN